MDTSHALSTIVEDKPIELAIAGWLDVHSRSARTHKTYAVVIEQFRGELRRIGADLDSDIRTLALVAQRYASSSVRGKEVSKNTRNVRLGAISSFYEYALARYLVAPMDDQGHIMNPLKIVAREKIEPYQGIHWLEPDEAEAALKRVDRASLRGKRDYALLVVLLNTGRRLNEVASLEWRHVHFKGMRITLTFENCKGGKTKLDTLNMENSKAVLTWLHAYYGQNLMSLSPTTPLWIALAAGGRNGKNRGNKLQGHAIANIVKKNLQVHTHITRHTFSQLMIKAGATLPELAARLGHESLKTTSVYASALTSDENPYADKISRMLGIHE